MKPHRPGSNFHNLSIHLSLIIIGITTLVLALFGAYRIYSQSVNLEKDLDISLENDANQLSASLSTALFNLDDETCSVICRAALAKQEIVRIAIIEFGSEYLSFTDDEFSTTRKSRQKGIEKPIFFKQNKIGMIKIVYTTRYLEEKIRSTKVNIIIQIVILDLLLGIALAVLLLFRFVRPLTALKDGSEKIAQGDLEYPINIHRKDEIGSLAGNLLVLRNSVKEKVEFLEAEIQDHEKTMAALEKSESFLRMIIDLIPHMIFVKDSAGRFLVVNEAVAKDFKMTVEEITGKLHIDIAQDKREAIQIRDDDKKVMENGETLSMVTESCKFEKDGIKWFSTKKVPFEAADGQNGIVVVSIDITDLKRAEEDLKKAKSYIDNIINSMPSILVSIDLDLNITQWNRQAETTTGIHPRFAIGKPLVEMLPMMKPIMEKVTRAIETGELQFSLKQHRKIKEEAVYENIMIYPLVANGVEGAVIRIDDVTENVNMEEVVIQSEKMMSVGGLAAGMAHEINNPLAGMIQNAQVVLRRIQEDMPASIKVAREVGTDLDVIRSFLEKRGVLDQLELIHETGVRAGQIVQNMLSFARKDASGKIKTDIALLLDQTIELAQSDYDLKKQYDFKKIEIVKEYGTDIPLVACTASKIQQVFFNIMKNSAEAMYEHDGFQDPKFTFRILDKDPYVCVEIEDNGPGMEKETEKRVFEPFFTTKSVDQGTGLGLSVSYFIVVDNHDGKMDVVSEPGRGTRFIIHLPVD